MGCDSETRYSVWAAEGGSLPPVGKAKQKSGRCPIALEHRPALRISIPEWLSGEGRMRQGRADLGSRPVKLFGIRGDPRDSWDLCGWDLAQKYRVATGRPSHKTEGLGLGMAQWLKCLLHRVKI